MDEKDLIKYLLDYKKIYELASENLEEFDYTKGLMDGAKIAISSVIRKMKKEDN